MPIESPVPTGPPMVDAFPESGAPQAQRGSVLDHGITIATAGGVAVLLILVVALVGSQILPSAGTSPAGPNQNAQDVGGPPQARSAATPRPTPTIKPYVPEPTARPTTRPPSAAFGSREHPVPTGDSVVIGDWSIRVTKVTTDASSTIADANVFNKEPASGYQFFMVAVEAKYLGSASEELPGRFEALGKSAVMYSDLNDCGVLPDPDYELSRPEVFAGGVIEGNVACWAIRKADLSSLVMAYRPSYISDERTWFEIKGGATTRRGSSATARPQATAKPQVKLRRVFTSLVYSGGGLSIAAEVKNTGSVPVLLSGAVHYTIIGKNGRVEETGLFALPVPSVIKPGQSGYYLDRAIFAPKSATSGRLEFTPDGRAFEGRTASIAVSHVFVKTALYGTTIEASGVAQNRSSIDLGMPVVGLLLVDSRGRVFAGAFDNLSLSTLHGKERRGFEATSFVIPGSLLKRASRRRVLVFDGVPELAYDPSN